MSFISKTNFKYLIVATFVAVALLYLGKGETIFESSITNEVSTASQGQKSLEELINLNRSNSIPNEALLTLLYVRAFDKAPEGYVGGRQFMNRERRLPHSENGQTIFYREWDIYKKVKEQNRGPRRLVSSRKKAYYTADHYTTFVEIEE
jgi:guanyl-specific ribonuclease Sa